MFSLSEENINFRECHINFALILFFWILKNLYVLTCFFQKCAILFGVYKKKTYFCTQIDHLNNKSLWKKRKRTYHILDVSTSIQVMPDYQKDSQR